MNAPKSVAVPEWRNAKVAKFKAGALTARVNFVMHYSH